MYFTLFGFPKLGHLRCLLSYTFKYISLKANLYSTFKLVEAVLHTDNSRFVKNTINIFPPRWQEQS